MGNEIPPQAGNDHPTGIPTGVFRTSDGHINIAAAGQQMYRRLCVALGVEGLVDDTRFRSPKDRSTNRAALTEELLIAWQWSAPAADLSPAAPHILMLRMEPAAIRDRKPSR